MTAFRVEHALDNRINSAIDKRLQLHVSYNATRASSLSTSLPTSTFVIRLGLHLLHHQDVLLTGLIVNGI